MHATVTPRDIDDSRSRRRHHRRRGFDHPDRRRHRGSAAGAARRAWRRSPPLCRLEPERSGVCTGRRCSGALGAVEPILLPDGERYKNLQSVAKVYDALIRADADRGSAIVAVGGGVIGDTAGFAAATFLRGITLVHVPTTLLAQVDSSIGGKVGVNHTLGKNLIGAFHQPRAGRHRSAAAADAAATRVPVRPYEVVKYGMIASRSLFDLLTSKTKAIFDRDPAVLVPAIVESCRIKADVVSKDERESGLRRILNYGHTVGHALEAVTKYRRYRHGEAIAYGMLAAADLAVARGALGGAGAPGAGTADCRARPAAAGRGSADAATCSKPSGATRRSSTDGCTSSSPSRSARR